MEATEKPKKKKEDLCALRKKTKRFEQSRDNLKSKNREKSISIKKLKDRLAELEFSRNQWKEKSYRAEKKCRIKETELNQAARERDSLKTECDQLKHEVENFKKKRKNLPSY